MPGNMLGKPVERVLDLRLVSDRCPARGEARKPGRALAVVGKQSMDIGSDHLPVGGDGAFRGSFGLMR